MAQYEVSAPEVSYDALQHAFSCAVQVCLFEPINIDMRAELEEQAQHAKSLVVEG
jgi:hypothetical protein